MASTPTFVSRSSERRWLKEIKKIIKEEVKVEIDVPISIFRVPATLSALKPEAYVPQLIGLGPYHRFRSELYEMERYKLAAVSRVQKQYQSNLEFEQLVDKLKELEFKVRACYHMYLDIEGETLTWIMAIDGLFLLEILHSYLNREDNHQSRLPTTAQLVDSAGSKLTHDGITRDLLMLENQIPIFLLRKIWSIQCSLPDVSNDLLPSMLMGVCKALSPLKAVEDLPLSQVSEHAHLLDLLYHLTVPKLKEPQEPGNKDGAERITSTSCFNPGNSFQVFAKLWNMLSNLTVISKITKPVKTIISLCKIATNPLGMSTLASKNKENIKPERNVSSEGKKTPIVDEIMITSVSRLCDIGVEFCPTTGGITTVKFDEKNEILYLPVITLNVNSEVIMRNLVAYEASIVSDSLVFTRYTELMNGIIDTAEDAKLLREKKIIVNSLKSDAEVAELFNGMSKAIRLTNVSYIDKAIEDVNKYFYNTTKVRVCTRFKKFVYGSWQILTILAVILVMLLMALQSFCSVYSCPKIFNTSS